MHNSCGKYANNLRTTRSKTCACSSTDTKNRIQKINKQWITRQFYTIYTHSINMVINTKKSLINTSYIPIYPHYPQDLLLLTLNKKEKKGL